jgi:hypothetical protein
VRTIRRTQRPEPKRSGRLEIGVEVVGRAARCALEAAERRPAWTRSARPRRRINHAGPRKPPPR